MFNPSPSSIRSSLIGLLVWNKKNPDSREFEPGTSSKSLIFLKIKFYILLDHILTNGLKKKTLIQFAGRSFHGTGG